MYKKAFELSYKNKKVEVEIQDFVGDVRNINGTEDLFSLSYISDSKDKGQSILVTEADINFYADDYFNIDELKTVGETDIKVKYYEDDILHWSGFVIPDFFSTSVDTAPVVSMVATDRIGTLKEVSNNAESNIPIQILASCLKQTGQDLPINLIADNNHFETPVQLERIEEIASYDVIRTFMVLFNCKITLYKNAWWIINKKLLESGFVNYKSYNSNGVGGSVTPFAQPILDIDLVDRGGQREIKPTASEISLFLEFGGSKKYPDNWNFEKWNGATFDNWTNHNGFSQGKRQTEIIFYTRIDGYYQVYLSEIETENKSLWYVARWYSNKLSDNILDYPNLKSSSVNVPKERGFIDIALNGNFTTRDGMPIWIVPLIHNKTNGNYFTYNKEGVILKIGSGTPNLNQSNFDYVHNPRASSQNGFNPDDMTHASVDVNWDIKNTFDLRDFGSDSDEIEMQVVFLGGIYSQGSLDYGTDVFLNSVNISFNDSQVTGKGLIFKIKQGGEKFSKSRETETILFSDKINQGVNGYFYNYKYDDTSIVDLPSEFALTSVRERADMFSKARDYYSLDGNFIVNPLAKYVCGLKSFVLVGGENRREDAGIIVEEIVSNTLNRTDFIYTYFDDGKDKVKTIGTASGGSSSGGGGSSPSTPQLIKVDEEGNYYSEQPFYSLGGLSAFGFSEVGGGDGGGGGIVDLSNYYTKVEVDSLIDNIEVGDIDLSNYYTKVEVDSLIDNIEVGDIDLSNYYTKVEVDSLIPDLSNYYTKVEVDSLIPDLSNYYTKVETYSKTEVDNLINGVGGGGGGGLIKEDSEGNYYSQKNFYSLGGLSAFGFSEVGDGNGGGGIINVIDNLTSTSKTDPLSANQGRYLKTLIDNIEVGEGGQVIVDWEAITGKPDTFAPSAHTHTIGDVTGLQGALDNKASLTQLNGKEDKFTKNSAFNKNFGTGLNDVARGNHTHAFESLTSIPTTLSGYGITDGANKVHTHAISDVTNLQTELNKKATNTALTTHVNKTDNPHSVTKAQVGLGSVPNIDFRSYGLGITTGQPPSIADLDDVTTPIGFYSYFNPTGTRPPRTITGGTILIEAYRFGVVPYIKQTITYNADSGGHMYYRTYHGANSQWSEWKEIYHSDNLTKSTLGLSNVDNTSDLLKPISNATQTALDSKLNKLTFDDLFEKVETSTGKWAVKVKYNLFSVGEISAFGFEEESGGSGGGSMNMMQDWTFTTATENYYLPAKLAVPFYNDTRSRLTTLEGGSATTVNVSGTGDLLASVSKVGNNIEFVKGNQSWGNLSGKPSTFAPSAHSHPISDITNLQSTLNSKLETSIFNTHNTDNIRHITGVERTKWDGVVTDFGNLEIGGRNLLLNSTDSYNGWSDIYGTQQITQDGYIKTYTSISPYARIEKIFTLSEIGTFTFSVKVETSVAIIWQAWEGLSIKDIKVKLIEDDFEIHSIAFENFTAGSKRIRGYQRNAPIGTTTLIEWEKLEKGNIPTDWTPAPEDQVSDWLTTDVNSFSFIKNKPTLLSQFTDNIGVATHIANKANPHSVTKAQVGLSNVDNIQQATKVEFMTQKALFDSMFRKVGTSIEAKLPLYSLGGLSAYGFSDEGSSSGGGIVNILPSWESYDTSKNGWALSAGLGENLRTRVVALENAEIDLSGYATLNYVNDKVKTNVPLNAKFTDTIVDISGKVDKKTGFSLISDTEITRLSNVTNQDLSSYAKTSDVNNLLGGKVDKVTGKSLISDTEITRLSSVTNQDLTPYALKTYVDTEVGKKWTYNETTIKAVKVSNAVRADNVGGFTVGVNVPSNAKFTDTIVDISGKVDKVSGKGLSTNDFTTVEKNKLAILENQTRESLGVDNVTNESKATMFANPTFTGTTKVTILELNTNWKVLKTGNELEFQYNNVKKATLTPNGDLIVMGGMTAYQ